MEESGRLRRRLNSFNQSDAGKKWAQHRQNLPVWGIRQGILDSLAEQDVLVVGGDTGCGKTTQVIYILRLIVAVQLGLGDRSHQCCNVVDVIHIVQERPDICTTTQPHWNNLTLYSPEERRQCQ